MTEYINIEDAQRYNYDYGHNPIVVTVAFDIRHIIDYGYEVLPSMEVVEHTPYQVCSTILSRYPNLEPPHYTFHSEHDRLIFNDAYRAMAIEIAKLLKRHHIYNAPHSFRCEEAKTMVLQILYVVRESTHAL